MVVKAAVAREGSNLCNLSYMTCNVVSFLAMLCETASILALQCKKLKGIQFTRLFRQNRLKLVVPNGFHTVTAT